MCRNTHAGRTTPTPPAESGRASRSSRRPPVPSHARTSPLDCVTEPNGDPGCRLPLGEYRAVPGLVGHAGDVAHHVLDGEVLLERVVAHVLAEARGADATVRHLADDRDVVVDP